MSSSANGDTPTIAIIPGQDEDYNDACAASSTAFVVDSMDSCQPKAISVKISTKRCGSDWYLHGHTTVDVEQAIVLMSRWQRKNSLLANGTGCSAEQHNNEILRLSFDDLTCEKHKDVESRIRPIMAAEHKTKNGRSFCCDQTRTCKCCSGSESPSKAKHIQVELSCCDEAKARHQTCESAAAESAGSEEQETETDSMEQDEEDDSTSERGSFITHAGKYGSIKSTAQLVQAISTINEAHRRSGGSQNKRDSTEAPVVPKTQGMPAGIEAPVLGRLSGNQNRIDISEIQVKIKPQGHPPDYEASAPGRWSEIQNNRNSVETPAEAKAAQGKITRNQAIASGKSKSGSKAEAHSKEHEASSIQHGAGQKAKTRGRESAAERKHGSVHKGLTHDVQNEPHSLDTENSRPSHQTAHKSPSRKSKKEMQGKASETIIGSQGKAAVHDARSRKLAKDSQAKQAQAQEQYSDEDNVSYVDETALLREQHNQDYSIKTGGNKTDVIERKSQNRNSFKSEVQTTQPENSAELRVHSKQEEIAENDADEEKSVIPLSLKHSTDSTNSLSLVEAYESPMAQPGEYLDFSEEENDILDSSSSSQPMVVRQVCLCGDICQCSSSTSSLMTMRTRQVLNARHISSGPELLSSEANIVDDPSSQGVTETAYVHVSSSVYRSDFGTVEKQDQDRRERQLQIADHGPVVPTCCRNADQHPHGPCPSEITTYRKDFRDPQLVEDYRAMPPDYCTTQLQDRLCGMAPPAFNTADCCALVLCKSDDFICEEESQSVSELLKILQAEEADKRKQLSPRFLNAAELSTYRRDFGDPDTQWQEFMGGCCKDAAKHRAYAQETTTYRRDFRDPQLQSEARAMAPEYCSSQLLRQLCSETSGALKGGSSCPTAEPQCCKANSHASRHCCARNKRPPSDLKSWKSGEISTYQWDYRSPEKHRQEMDKAKTKRPSKACKPSHSDKPCPCQITTYRNDFCDPAVQKALRDLARHNNYDSGMTETRSQGATASGKCDKQEDEYYPQTPLAVIKETNVAPVEIHEEGDKKKRTSAKKAGKSKKAKGNKANKTAGEDNESLNEKHDIVETQQGGPRAKGKSGKGKNKSAPINEDNESLNDKTENAEAAQGGSRNKGKAAKGKPKSAPANRESVTSTQESKQKNKARKSLTEEEGNGARQSLKLLGNIVEPPAQQPSAAAAPPITPPPAQVPSPVEITTFLSGKCCKLRCDAADCEKLLSVLFDLQAQQSQKRIKGGLQPSGNLQRGHSNEAENHLSFACPHCSYCKAAATRSRRQPRAQCAYESCQCHDLSESKLMLEFMNLSYKCGSCGCIQKPSQPERQRTNQCKASHGYFL